MPSGRHCLPCTTYYSSWNPPNNLAHKQQKTLRRWEPPLRCSPTIPSLGQKIRTQRLLYALSGTAWCREQKDERGTFPGSHGMKTFENKWDRRLWRESRPGWCYFGQGRLLRGGDTSVSRAKEKMEDDFREGGKHLGFFWTLERN